MKKILITGSNGLLGQKLVELLVKNTSHEVIATARGENRLPSKDGYIYEAMDITNSAQVHEVIDRIQPTVIINTAAMTNVDMCETAKDDCWKQNVNAVEYLVEAAEKK